VFDIDSLLVNSFESGMPDWGARSPAERQSLEIVPPFTSINKPFSQYS